VLDKLVETGTINNYDDKSDPKSDTFDFTVSVPRAFFTKYTDESDWIQVFKLSKILNEQLNCIDKDNRVIEFNNIKEMLDSFIEIRLSYYGLRRQYLLDKFGQQILINKSKWIWCKGIIDETIKIKNTPKDKVISQLEHNKDIYKKDDSYNYLLNMPLTSITKEKMDELKNSIEELQNKINDLKATSDSDFMVADLDSLHNVLS
jgi:DNA topoisomerase-2